jgi:aminoglycoside 3-N-acetyltransferase
VRVQSNVESKQIVQELRSLGVRAGDVVLVHSSLSGLGWVEGGAITVVEALLAAVGDGGTVLFPTLTGSQSDGPGHPPIIELATTPCWSGAIPESARRRPDAIRSVHPTHSVAAIGARAEEFTRGHEESSTPCDERSPYARLMEEGGKILLLGGVTHKSNTTLHALEELAAVPYHLQDEETDGLVILPNGHRVIVRNRLHLWGRERNFPKVGALLTDEGGQVQGPVGASISTLVSAGILRDVLLPVIQRDPLFLLADSARKRFLSAQVP